MRVIIDLIIINICAVAAFILREIYGYSQGAVIKTPASVFLVGYIITLVLWDFIFVFIFWLLGIYDKRQKRALLEEFLLIFGVFSTGLAVVLVFMFLGRLWWISRAIVFIFWGVSLFFLCLARIIWKSPGSGEIGRSRLDVADIRSALADRKKELAGRVNDPLTIIIVSYNSKDKLSSALPSLKAAGLKQNVEVVLVDNNSTDGSAQYAKSVYPGIKVIENKQNLGYSAAINLGLRSSASNYCLILNPDVEVMPGSIEVMLEYALKNPRVGIAGCKLLNDDGSLQYSVRRFLDLRTYLYRFTPLRGIMAGSALERYYLMQDWDHKDNRLVDWVLGGCMLVKKEAFQSVGMMDERFFVYFEDVDWCFRMWENGWKVAYVAEAAMFHKHLRTSANKLLDRATREHFKSLFYFIRKHGFRIPKNCPSSLE